MKNRGKKVAGGDNQINVGLSDEQFDLLQAFVRLKGFRTVQDGLRYMVEGARGFVDRQLKTSSTSPVRQPAEISSSGPAVDDVESTALSDDGVGRPSFVELPPKPAMTPAATVQPELDEDGQELSEAERIRRARAKPAMDDQAEVMRWASLRDEV